MAENKGLAIVIIVLTRRFPARPAIAVSARRHKPVDDLSALVADNDRIAVLVAQREIQAGRFDMRDVVFLEKGDVLINRLEKNLRPASRGYICRA